MTYNDKTNQHVENRYMLEFFFVEIEANGKSTMTLLYAWFLPCPWTGVSHYLSDGRFRTLNEVKCRFPILRIFASEEQTQRVFESLEQFKSVSAALTEIDAALPSGFDLESVNILPIADLVRRPEIWYVDREQEGLLGSPFIETGAWAKVLFCLKKEEFLNTGLISEIVSRLNFNTAMKFNDLDAARLGNIEWFCWQGKSPIDVIQKTVGDDRGKRISCKSVIVKLRAGSFSPGSQLLVRTRLTNAKSVVSDTCKLVNAIELGTDIEFEASEEISGIQVAVWGYFNGTYKLLFEKSFNLLRDIVGYMGLHSRTIEIKGEKKLDEKSVVGPLAKRIRSLQKAKYLHSNKSIHIGGNKFDPWRGVTNTIIQQIRNIIPESTRAKFFRQGWGDNGAIAFREWLKQLSKSMHPNGQITVIDPYFDEAGIHALLQMEELSHEYVILMNSNATKDPAARRTKVIKVLQAAGSLFVIASI